ncbi:16S rRNA (adenine(1518)-N(6)/adenine(1519)-N(6))-dimethyltransferase RsmA [Papillibacter cinnamivorans]|uniref:Ribosomal RNA small subunit methyltransferase A n=1 Tax=Papillibacter cinnamivorans DSM 12816 TaxID=1122930 RepID=A0A1W1ZD50_9FIRM|nr:16S rRNA (adenine(1518)-N(6)/adenine(1519)-N(6))-dimethyltransferase RsmA [Papillibacter cinnamivorans]SMC46081.1 16S rRNA (adenine1518-N6/adenine1519-N6)-dimethyltransferase [Papillibacter cinnamivorans DSM 12816]
MDLCSEKEIKSLLDRHGFRFSRSKGQNFLVDGRVPEEIVRRSGIGEDCGVLEIGPGIGALTVCLSQAAGRVLAVELDRALLPLLSETLSGCGNVEVLSGDVLKLDLPELVRSRFAGFRPMVCANLPYNITSPVLTALLESECFQAVTVMVQREVALRLTARPGTSEYGAFTLFLQYYAVPELLFDVPPESFLPRPRVTSSVIRLRILDSPPASVPDKAFFFRVVRGAFAQRRKTLVNALSAALGIPDKDVLVRVLSSCGLSPDIRGERLSFEEFALLSRSLKEAL